MCTLLVFFLNIFLQTKKRLHYFFFVFFLPLESSAAASVATNRKELHAESSNILPCSATLCQPVFVWPGQTWRVFQSLQSHLRTKYAPQETECGSPAHLSTFFLFQNTGTTTLTRTHTRWSLKTSRRPTSQSCRACRPSTRPATPSDTTQKTWSIQIWGRIRMCCRSQWVLLWAWHHVLFVCSVLFFAQSTIWFAGSPCLFLHYGSIYALGRWFHAEYSLVSN